jgi:predicted neuraminidase
LLNVSDLVKNKPARLAGGGWAVPLYNETARRYPELLWLGDRAYAKRRIAPATDFFQPSLVPLDATRAVALLRDGSPTKAVQRATTEDAGRTWSAPVATALPNPDSGLDAVRLPDGRLLLAFNDAKRQRANLRLAVSRDDGRTWSVVATIEDQPGGAFSYPALLVSRSGNIHLVYSAARRVIKHVIFNAAWLDRVAERGQG